MLWGASLHACNGTFKTFWYAESSCLPSHVLGCVFTSAFSRLRKTASSPYSALVRWDPIWSTVLRSGLLSKRQTSMYGKMVTGPKHLRCEERPRGFGFFGTERGCLRGHRVAGFYCVTERYRDESLGSFWEVPGVRQVAMGPGCNRGSSR